MIDDNLSFNRTKDISSQYQALAEIFPNSTWDDYNFYHSSDQSKIIVRTYNEVNNLFFSTTILKSKKDITLTEFANNDKEGIIRYFDKAVTFEEDSNVTRVENSPSNCLFVTNNQAPLTTHIPKGIELNFMTIRFNVNGIEKSKRFNRIELLKYILQHKFWLNQHFLTPEMLEIINKIFSKQDETIQNQILESLGLALQFFGMSLELITNEKDENKLYLLKESSAKRILNIQSELIRNIQSKISIEELSTKYGISSNTLRVDFKKAFGKSPNAWINEYKLTEAKRFILSTDLPLINIAFDLGYNDLAHFSNAFKKKHGVTPSNLRKV